MTNSMIEQLALWSSEIFLGEIATCVDFMKVVRSFGDVRMSSLL